MLYTSPVFQAFDDNGDPLNGGKLYTYSAGTTTPKTTYSDYDYSTPNSNPIILDARGEADPIYGQGWYKWVLKDSNDVEIWTFDNIPGTGCCSALEEFTNADLASGVLTVSHGWEVAFLRITVYDESGLEVIPEYIDSSSDEEFSIGFGDVTLSGTWKVRHGP